MVAITISQMAIAYSLEVFIGEKLDMPAHIKFDGFEMPEDKPFAIIEYRQNNTSQLSKARESMQTIFRIQLGIFAESSWKLSEYQEKLRNLFMFNKIPLYNDEGILTDSFFLFEPDFNEVPISSGDITDKTSRHRMYFDLEVRHVFNMRGNK